MALKMFIPITKIDAAQRLVYGVATAEAVDRSNEICDYEGTKPYYEQWSEGVQKASDGKSLGNVRAMHGSVAAGKLTQLAFNDEAKQIEVCAKVVDDAEWNKVEEGVYTGFSQGGAYVRKWKDPDDPTKTRYIANPTELSLVDLPCLPGATFEAIKADGAKELRKFKVEPKVPTNDQVAARATELAKAAGDAGKWAAHVEAARKALEDELNKVDAPAPDADDPPVEDTPPAELGKGIVPPLTKSEPDPTPNSEDIGVEQFWHAKDGTPFKKKADAMAHTLKVEADEKAAKAAQPASDLLGQIADALGKKDAPKEGDKKDPPTATEGDAKAASKKGEKKADKAAKSLDLAKGLYSIGTFARILDDIKCFTASVKWESDYEEDNSPSVPALRAWLAQGATLLSSYVEEQVAELAEGLNEDVSVEVLEAAAKPLANDQYDAMVKAAGGGKLGIALRKAGARNNKKDQEAIQKVHDHSVELGASCGMDSAEKMAKAALTTMTAERDALAKRLDDMTPMLQSILELVKKIDATPMPGGPARTELVRKELDGLPPAPDGALVMDGIDLSKATPDQLATILIKAAQRNGQNLVPRNSG